MDMGGFLMKLGRDCLIALLLVAPIQAGEVAAPTIAKIIRIVASSGNNVKVACLDPEVAAELGKLGLSLDPEARIVWAISDQDVVRLAKQNKLVICGQLGQLAQGGAVAIVAEGGRPSIYIRPANVALSKVSLPDAVIKIGKVVK